jgi:hypothetical protein
MVVPLRVSAIKLGQDTYVLFLTWCRFLYGTKQSGWFNLFPEFNMRLYDKNSESDYFFSSTKIRIFFSATERIRIFFISLEENHN